MDDATQSLCRKYRGKVAEYLVAMQDKEDDAVDTKEHPSSSESTLFTAFFTAISYFNQALILLIQERGKAFQYKKISMMIRPSSSIDYCDIECIHACYNLYPVCVNSTRVPLYILDCIIES